MATSEKSTPITVAGEQRFQYSGQQLDSWFSEIRLDFPGHDAIWAMATADDGRVYIGLAGEHNRGDAMLIALNVDTREIEIIADCVKLFGDQRAQGRMPHSKIHFAICPVGDDVFFATHVSGALTEEDLVGPIGAGPIADPISGFEGGRLLRYNMTEKKLHSYGVIVAGEGIRCLRVAEDASWAAGITYPKHRFFYKDLKTDETYISGRVGRFGGIDLFVDAKGLIWGAHDGFEGTQSGQMYYFDPATRRLVDVPAFLPRSTADAMSYPEVGSHVLHMTDSPDGQALVSSYGESRVAMFDPVSQRVWDWGAVWDRPPVRKLKEGFVKKHHHLPSHHLKTKPYFAWCPAFGPAGSYTVGDQTYDRLVWYGEERWEYERNVRLVAVAYRHDDPGQFAKVLYGTPNVEGHHAGHWAASAVLPDGRICFADRVRGADAEHGKFLRVTVFRPPTTLSDLTPVE
jgi:hypothetical protein